MTQSTFYHDGYRDGTTNTHPCPPNVAVYAAEYWAGYWDAVGGKSGQAQRLANQPLRPVKPQAPADHGLFSDEANQLDLIEMFMD